MSFDFSSFNGGGEPPKEQQKAETFFAKPAEP